MVSDGQVQRKCCCTFASYRWRRYVPFLVFVMVIVFVQFNVVTIRNPQFLQDTIRTLTNLRHRKNETTGPLHVLLVTYARTGSSFLGDLLQTLPSTFYYFEPLHFISGPVLNGSYQEARALLDQIFRCKVTSIDGFLRWQKINKGFMKFKRSLKYWKECSKANKCFDGPYIDAYCRRHDLIVAKTIRLNLEEAARLFDTHPHLNLKVIYLIRDPRGSLNSRTKFPVSQWCKRDPMCSDPRHFCSTLSEDLRVVCRLSRERPDDFTAIRYEDLSLDPFTVAGRLVRFLRLPSMPLETEQFLKTHTSVIGSVKEKYVKQGVDYPYSTFRNSSLTSTVWRQEMSFQRVADLQNTCRDVLNVAGYYSYSTVGTLRSNVNMDKPLVEALRLACTDK